MVGQPKASQAQQKLDVQHQVGGPFVQAVDATSMAMIVTDPHAPDNPIIFANGAFLALTGYSLDEVIGKNYHMLYGPRTDPQTAKKVDEALHARGDIVLESLLYRKDGRGIWVMQHVSIQRENGEVKRHFASFFDIDRRVRAENEVRRAQGLLEQRVKRRTSELSRLVADLQRENQKRAAAEEVLRHTLADKEHLIQQREVLIREVNHRVKNTLQLASALLTVQAGTTQDESVAKGLKAAIGRLGRLAEVHRLLYESSNVTIGVNLDAYLTELCQQLVLASDRFGRITLDVAVDEGVWSADEAIPIALIVNEAVTNALKHAFPDNRSGTIGVALRDIGQSLYELAITDDGVGGETPIRPGSLGMQLIETFARQLQGALTIDHDGGTTVAVRFLHADEGPKPPIAE